MMWYVRCSVDSSSTMANRDTWQGCSQWGDTLACDVRWPRVCIQIAATVSSLPESWRVAGECTPPHSFVSSVSKQLPHTCALSCQIWLT